MDYEGKIVGQKIVGIRKLTQLELDEEGWEKDTMFPAICLVLEDGSLLFASQDDEGNGSGCLFGRTPKGEGFVLTSLK